MRYLLSSILVVFVSMSLSAQVGIGTTTIDASAMLQIDNITQGVLVPRMTQVQRNAIASPATGLLVYQTDGAIGFYYYYGGLWSAFGGGAAWDILGNSGTTSATNMLGTSDVQDISLVTNNSEGIRVTSNGEVGIGTTTPTAMLVVTSPNVTSVTQDFETVATGVLTTSTASDPYFIDNNVSCVAADGWQIETFDASSTFCAGCSGNRAIIDYGAVGCAQDATLVVDLGTINSTSIDISFDYDYDDYTALDQFTVILYNETTSSVETTLLGPLTADQGANFSQTVAGITSGDDYSIRFIYIADYGNGVTVDNILATLSSPVLRIQDGNEANGYVMLSDASGNATWTDTTTIAAADDDWAFATAGTTNTDPIYRIGDVSMANANAPLTDLDIEENTLAGEFTEIGIGSDEYFYDRLSETSLSHSIVPTVHNSVSCGSATLRWNTVYATNTTISTSDKREKIAIKPLNHGLNSLLKLRPVTYKWKNEVYGKTVLTDIQKRTKIGFIAQEVQQIIPEIVVANEWRQKSEKEASVYIKREVKRLGIRYSEVLPVVVNATQEHQVFINKLKKQQEEISLLLKELK